MTHLLHHISGRLLHLTRLLGWSAAVLLLCSHTAWAEEFAIVSDDSLRLTADGETVAEVPHFQLLDVVRREGKHVVVSYKQQEFRIATSQIYLSSQFPFVNDGNRDDMRYVVESMELAMQSADDDKPQLALKVADQARQRLQLLAPDGSLVESLILHFQALQHRDLGDCEEALAVLEQSTTRIENLQQTQHFVFADALHVRALVYVEMDRLEDAIDDYQQASLILLNSLGSQHMDTASVFSNLAYAQYTAEHYSEAWFMQRIAINAMSHLLPADDARLPVEHYYLGATGHEIGRYESAAAALRTAIDLYQRHHPELQEDTFNSYVELAYVYTEQQDYAAADSVCDEALEFTAALPAPLQSNARKTVALRAGRVDFEQQQYDAAISHFQTAVSYFMTESPDEEDGAAEEWLGDVYVAQEKLGDAKQAYERSITRYAAANGPECDDVLTLREYADNLETDYDNTLADIVMVDLPQGYLLDNDGQIAHTVPGLTVLKWRQSDDQFHTVEYNDELYRLSNDQLRTFRNLPGYAQARPKVFSSLLQGVSDAIRALSQGNIVSAQKQLEVTIDFSEIEYGSDTSLTLWLKLMEIAVHSKTQGPQAAIDQLAEMQPQLDAVNPAAYDFTIDVSRIRGGCLMDLDNANAAAESYRTARDTAAEQLGDLHVVTINNTRHLAKSLRYDQQFEEALAEFERAHAAARQTYPVGATEPAEIASELSIVLVDLQRLDEAEELLTETLEAGKDLPPEQYITLAASLSRVYLSNGNDASARELATAVLEELSTEDHSQMPGLMSLQVLARLSVKQEQWEEATQHLSQLLAAMEGAGLADNFAAAEVHQQFADALLQLDRPADAREQLQQVLRIYDVLGGGDSPQADAVRKQLENIAAEMAATADTDTDTDTQTAGMRRMLETFLILNPTGEAMQIITADGNVTASADPDSPVIGHLDVGTAVWSLEQRDHAHRIYLPAAQSEGWLAADNVTAESAQIVQRGREQLQELVPADAATELQAVFDRMETALAFPVATDSEQKLALLAASLEEIDSASQSRSLLLGVLFAEVLRTRSHQLRPVLTDVENEEMFPAILRTYGHHHPVTAAFRFSRARIAKDLGQFDAETSELEEILKVCERHLGERHPRTLMYRAHLAASAMHGGHFDVARDQLETVVRLSADDERLLFVHSLAHRGLGELDATRRSLKTAITHLQTALEGFRATPHLVTEAIQESYRCLIWCHLQHNDVAAAQAAVDAMEQPFAPVDAELLLPLWQRKLELAARQPGDLEPTLVAAAEAADAVYDQIQDYQTSSLYRAFSLARARTHVDESLRGLTTAMRQENEHLQQAIFHRPPQQIAIGALTEQHLAEATSLSLQFDRADVHEATATWVVNLHNRLPQLLAVRRRALSLIDDEPTMAAFLRWDRANRQMMKLPESINFDEPDQHIAASVARLQEAESTAFAALPEAIRDLYADTPTWHSLASVQAAMSPTDTMIVIRPAQTPGLMLAADNPTQPDVVYAAWIIPPVGAPRVLRLADAADVEQSVTDSVRIMRAVADAHKKRPLTAADVRREQKAVDQLSRRLWHPIRDALPADTQQILLCVDDQLQAVPWAALSSAHDDRLLEEFQLSYLLSARDILDSLPEHSGPSVMISQPDYRLPDPDVHNLPAAEQQLLVDRTRGSKRPQNRAALVDALTVPPEATDLLSLLEQDLDDDVLGDLVVADELRKTTGQPPTFYQLEQASDYRLLTAQPGAVLHIHTDGFCDLPTTGIRADDFLIPAARHLFNVPTTVARNPLMQCGLLLAGCGVASSDHHLTDGVLTGEEIAGLSLQHTRLVVLQVAPQTTDGAPLANIAMLPTAFRLAGAGEVISLTLPIKDAAGQTMLRQLYQQLATGKSAAAALRDVQLETRRQLSEPSGYTPVATWAGWRVTGGPRSEVTEKSAEAAPNTPEPVPDSGDDSSPDSQPTEALDRTDARAVATAVLRRYGHKDIEGVLALSTEGPVSPRVLQQYAPGTVRYKSLFQRSAWRWRAVQSWNGELANVVYTRRRQPAEVASADGAQVEFGRSATEVFVVTLTRDGEKWLFEDIHSPATEDWPGR